MALLRKAIEPRISAVLILTLSRVWRRIVGTFSAVLCRLFHDEVTLPRCAPMRIQPGAALATMGSTEPRARSTTADAQPCS